MEKITISLERANDILQNLNIEIVPNNRECYEIYKSVLDNFHREDTQEFLERTLGYDNFDEDYLERFYKTANEMFDKQGDMTFIECLENVDKDIDKMLKKVIIETK